MVADAGSADSPQTLSDAKQGLDNAKIFGDYVGGCLSEGIKEQDRLDTRTSLIVTSSGALITAIGILWGLLPKDLPRPELIGFRFAALVSIVPFLVTIVIALTANLSVGRHVTRVPIDKIADSFSDWAQNLSDSTRVTEMLKMAVKCDLDTSCDLREANCHRNDRLRQAGYAQLAGIGMIVAMVAAFLLIT